MHSDQFIWVISNLGYKYSLYAAVSVHVRETKYRKQEVMEIFGVASKIKVRDPFAV